MKTNVIKLLEKALQNSKNTKIGDSNYRTLIINDLKESEKAIKFMERLGLAYRVEYLDGVDPVEIRLPAVSLAYGKIFQGLDAIKYYGKTAFGPWPGEFEDLKIRKPIRR